MLSIIQFTMSENSRGKERKQANSNIKQPQPEPLDKQDPTEPVRVSGQQKGKVPLTAAGSDATRF